MNKSSIVASLASLLVLITLFTTVYSKNYSNKEVSELSASQKTQAENFNHMMLKTIQAKLISLSDEDMKAQIMTQKLNNVLCALSDEDFVILNSSEYNSVLKTVGLRCSENVVEFVQNEDSMHIYSRDLMRDYMNGMVVTKP